MRTHTAIGYRCGRVGNMTRSSLNYTLCIYILIQPTGAEEQAGYRTIMAYNGFGHYTRVNKYIVAPCLSVDMIVSLILVV